jgi:hypothetical protein
MKRTADDAEEVNLEDIPMKELADRISAALHRGMVMTHEHGRYAGPKEKRQKLDKPTTLTGGASYQRGGFVHVWYKHKGSWHNFGQENLTRLEAAHYLFALEHGYKGTHDDYFLEDPPPERPDDAKTGDIQMVVLVRNRWGFALWGVTKVTKARLFGRTIKGGANWSHYADYVDRGQLVKQHATEKDLKTIERAHSKMRTAQRKAEAEFNEAVRNMVNEVGS